MERVGWKIMSVPIHKRIAEFIEQHILGCRFVGIGDGNEVFVSFDHEDEGLTSNVMKTLKLEFSEISKITIVHSVSLQEVTKLVNSLNKEIEDLERKEPEDNNSPLLDIGTF